MKTATNALADYRRRRRRALERIRATRPPADASHLPGTHRFDPCPMCRQRLATCEVRNACEPSHKF
jgi:hypothetical protein